MSSLTIGALTCVPLLNGANDFIPVISDFRTNFGDRYRRYPYVADKQLRI